MAQESHFHGNDTSQKTLSAGFAAESMEAAYSALVSVKCR